MASSSSPNTCVFTSFHGPDVRKTFLSHLRKQFNCNGITMFDDQGIKRSQTIGPALTRAIRESRISIVILSKKYASSSWCLSELVEILERKRVSGQIVMTVFHGVDPSHVRKQIGEFGNAFKETCSRSTKEERRSWCQALIDVGNIAGEHFLNWDNEADMIDKIVRDVSDTLNFTQSKDFDGMVGLDFHVRKISSLLCLECDEVKIVGIYGPAGIGKTTIARALYSVISSSFQLSCFMDDNLRESYTIGLDEYGLKLRLQEQLLLKIFNQNGMRICHLGVIQERLCDQRVLIILDDVQSLNQLEALANEPSWFGPGSKVIVITENKEILQQHGIKDTYHVGFPSTEEALRMFCLSAFRQTSPPDGFMKLANEVSWLCGDLPLGLHVLGSSLRGKSQADWIDELPRLKSSLDGRIEKVLKVGYERLHEKDQALFLHIAFFLNGEPVDYVTTMLAKTNLNVGLGLKILANRSLIQTNSCSKKRVVMHHLLQVMAKQVISKQEPWERQILVDAKQISYVLENATGNGSILGISFDLSEINELTICVRAFENLCNLLFLKVNGGGSRLHVPEEMDYLPSLRLLHWEEYPRKSLPLRFCRENLVELYMQYSQLEKLWEGIQPLTSLKKMDLSRSYHLKELPDLSNATNLERLELNGCWSLVELPSSIANLHKLKKLVMVCCINLVLVPTNINLASLERVNMGGCSRLKTFPDISTNIRELLISNTALEVEPESLRRWSGLSYVDISNNKNLKTLTHVPESVAFLDLSYSGIEKIPDWIRGIHGLQHLKLAGCRKLTALPKLPGSLTFLSADNCASLERVTCLDDIPNAKLNFTNCFKLSGEAQRKIVQRSFLDGWACLPGKQVPAEFNHRANGNSLTIHLEGKRFFSASSRFTACVMISPKQQTRERCFDIRYSLIGKSGWSIYKDVVWVGLPRGSPGIGTEHLCIFHCDFPEEEICLEVGSEILFVFRCPLTHLEIFECGVRIDTDEANIKKNESNNSRLNQVSEGNDDDRSYEFEHNQVSEDPDNSDCNDGLCCTKSKKVLEEEDNVQGKEHTNCWSWLFICFSLSHIARNIGGLSWGRRCRI